MVEDLERFKTSLALKFEAEASTRSHPRDPYLEPLEVDTYNTITTPVLKHPKYLD